MKKLSFLFLLCVASFMMASCDKDTKENNEVKSFNSFIVENPNFTSGSSDEKSFIDFTNELSRILYEDGDVLYVNGEPFTLHYQDGHWQATGASVSAEEFYMCHADGTVSNWSSPSYNVSLVPEFTSGIVMRGQTNSNIVTLNPEFAVLVFKPAEVGEYTAVRVGFDNGKVPFIFNLSASDGSMSGNISYFPHASSDYHTATMLTMQRVSDYFYVAIPIKGSSVTTKLYFMYEKVGETEPILRITSGEVTLTKKKVYIIPDEDISELPFDEDGVGLKKFSVSASQKVYFSAGNLQYQASEPGTAQKVWRFAPHQYDVVSIADNEAIAGNYQGWIDLFGFGCTGYRNSGQTHTQYRPHNTNNDGTLYCGTDLTNKTDWGYNYVNYNSNQSHARWRTLSIDEWNYLLKLRTNASSLKGGATINGVKGLIILPDADEWEAPESPTFSNGNSFNSNVYSLQQWDKLEKRGAIFLPINGRRSGTTVSDETTLGFYWSATVSSTGNARRLAIDELKQNTATDMSRAYGCLVRLVTDE